MFFNIIVFLFFKRVYSSEAVDLSTANFSDLVSAGYFVDKTDVIKTFFHSAPVEMIATPRRFGKSVNMDIIKTFSEIVVDENGTRVPRELTNNHDIFSRNNLNVYKDSAFFSKHFGMYPVILLNFKSVRFTKHKSFLTSFKYHIVLTYNSHKYLLNSDKLSEEDKNRFKQYSQGKLIRTLENYELHKSIINLSHLLYKHFNETKCIILIDDFDAYIQELVVKSGKVIDLIVDFIFQFVSTSIKSNNYLNRALINTCIRIDSLLPADTAYINYNLFLWDHNFYPFYGFTEEEIKSLLIKKNKLDKLADAKKWYDGYRAQNMSVIMYNPLSIVKFVETNEPKDYWIQSGSTKTVKGMFIRFEIHKKVYLLLCNNFTAKITYLKKLNIKHIIHFKEIVTSASNVDIKPEEVDLFYQVLTDQGYFNIISPLVRNEVTIKIPNHEIQEEIKKYLYIINYKFKHDINNPEER